MGEASAPSPPPQQLPVEPTAKEEQGPGPRMGTLAETHGNTKSRVSRDSCSDTLTSTHWCGYTLGYIGHGGTWVPWYADKSLITTSLTKINK